MESLFDKVVSVLSPDLGNTTARASVKMFLKEFSVSPDAVGPEHLDQLAAKIKPGLHVFVGKTKAETLTNKILSLHHERRAV